MLKLRRNDERLSKSQGLGEGSRSDFSNLQGNGDIPKTGMYALTNQIQRAAVSIPANIAEGCGKDSDAELKRYFLISMGSSSELEYVLLLAYDLGYLPSNTFQSMNDDLVETRKMLNAFIQKPLANGQLLEPNR